MLTKPKFFLQRRENLYKQEISRILHKITRENYSLPSFSLSYCHLKGENNLKIYLNFVKKEGREELLKLMNIKYSLIVKKEIAKERKFAYVPTLQFFLDERLESINSLEEIIQKIK
jgi:ribosome-binding factor A